MPNRGIIRVYADTSVFGGIFDAEFEFPTKRFFERVDDGKFSLVTSALVAEEIEPAPTKVRSYFERVSKGAEFVHISAEVLRLRQAYLHAGIVTPKSSADALHVALATAHNCSVLVSWNCRHIVHFQKIPRYNAVSRLHGFHEVAIHTPLELINDEDDEEEV